MPGFRILFVLAILAASWCSGVALVSADPKPPSISGGKGGGSVWVKARLNTRSTHRLFHPLRRQTFTAGVTRSSSTGPRELPTTTFYSIIGGQAYCGGGRALVACTLPTVQPVAAAARPQVTPGVVMTAMRRIGLPALAAHTQPEGKTLVNFATIFYTDPQPFTRTVTLLGRTVTIAATPQTFTWHYGDGTSSSTSTPGAPYPAKDVTHNYRDAHRTVLTSVDVSYSARFHVGGGAWEDIPGTVTIAGPTSPLRISEATALLSGDYG